MITLDIFGKIIYFMLGLGIGVAIMYFGPIIVEMIDEAKEK